MSGAITAADRSALIRLASSMDKGSEERRALLAGLQTGEIEDQFGSELDTVDARAKDLLPVGISLGEMYRVTLEGSDLGVAFAWALDPKVKGKDLLGAINWLLKNPPVKISSAQDLVDLLGKAMSSSGHAALLAVKIPTRGFSKEFLAALPYEN